MPLDRSGLPHDVVLDALQEPRRRFAFVYLQRQDRHVTLDELARETAAWETDALPSEIDEERQYWVRLSLHHVHLPKFADVGLVEYTDDERHAVEPTELLREVASKFDLNALVERRQDYGT